jgi:putative intracellular protease/amidase
MMTKTVHVAVYDTLADWEVGHTIAHLRNGNWHREPGGFEVKLVAISTEPVVSMGGMRIVPDLALADLAPSDSAMLIMPGSGRWTSDDAQYPKFTDKAQEFLAAGVPVAAICGATQGMARAGLFNEHRHTSGGREALTRYEHYTGADRYVDADAVTDGDLISAGPTEPVAFAREIFRRLDVYAPEKLDAWFRLFSSSDATAYYTLMSA